MTTPNQLATVPSPGQLINTLDDMERVAKLIAGNGMFGITTVGQAIGLFLLCQAEGINPVMALRQYHIIEGKPSMRADAMVGKFEAAGGGIFWHARTDKMAVATFYADKKTMLDPKAIERARVRAVAMLDGDEKTAMEQAHPGEVTIIRTLQDAIDTGLATTFSKEKNPKTGTFDKILKANWERNKRQMLAARASTEGVRAINPGLIAGIVSEDEARDIADQTQERFHALVDAPDNRDRDAMEEILAQHERSADAAKTDQERKHYQGLAAEMRCKIADLDVTPAATAPTVAGKLVDAEFEVETPEEESAREAAAKKPEPKAPADPSDWRTADFSHRNLKTNNPCYGKTVGDIFDTGSIDFAKKIMPSLKKNFIGPMDEAVKKHEDGEGPEPHPADLRLWHALNAAEKRLAERIAEEGK